uniref:Uncharacterized protein n=1 Tax=Zooxanthella nutricula TaxID=1333877 RepID=A0A7S2Q7D1_9DINO|mmetsp:Transcript_79551/g.243345  ORF Transcript_79551/g.243345 Transcript_79551/m.243345 type:complete len:283 (+) Transcript_79551:3-851(+)
MVTHAWSNFFTDLVAAIVAEALGQDRYIEAAGLLAEGRVEELKGRLRDAGTLQQVYWVCAFSINQHAGICGDFGPEPREPGPRHDIWAESRLNTVSKEVYPLCPCREPKYFNDAPVPCELNKFDDMMALLVREAPEFTQVVAVDRRFDLFTRLWCIAELVQAHLSGIEQRVSLLSNRVLEADNGDLSVYVKLTNLKVSECSATRVEDKLAILAKIPDTHEFDAQLQALIFGEHGLLARHLVGFGALEAAGRTARRIAAATGEGFESEEEEPPRRWCGELRKV